MAPKTTLYVRNARPNGVVFHYDGVRYALRHRGHREDSVALPGDAASDPTVSRWISIGQLEKISKDDFMQLGQRTVDIAPNEYLKRGIRESNAKGVPMQKDVADTTGALTQVDDRNVGVAVKKQLSPEWAGDLMSTEEELESGEFKNKQSEPNYPSRHRDDTREAGY